MAIVEHMVPHYVNKLLSALENKPQVLQIMHTKSWGGTFSYNLCLKVVPRATPATQSAAGPGSILATAAELGAQGVKGYLDSKDRSEEQQVLPALWRRAFCSGVGKKGTVILSPETANPQSLLTETSLAS